MLLASAGLAGNLVIVTDDASGKYPAGEHAQVFSVLDSHEARGAFFVIPLHKDVSGSVFSLADHPELSAYIRKEAKVGNEFGLHGLYHTPYEFGDLSYDEALYRIVLGRSILENSTGLRISHFKPPYWAENNGTINALQSAGLKDANNYDYREYTWYLEPKDLNSTLARAEEDYRSAMSKEKPFFLLMHVHAVNYGAGLEFLDRFLSFVESERGNVFPLSKYELLAAGNVSYLNSAESLSTRIDSLRKGYPIYGLDPFSGRNGTFPATQAWDVSGELILAQLTGKHEYFKRAEKSARWLVLNQNKSGFWERKSCDGCEGIFTVEGSEAGLALLDMYEYTNDSTYLDSAILWSDFLLNNISFQNVSGTSIAFEYQYPAKHWRVVNINALNGLFFLRLWKATGNEEYLGIGNRSLDFVLGSQLGSGQYPYRFDSMRGGVSGRMLRWLYQVSPKTGVFKDLSARLKRLYQSESAVEGWGLLPVDFQEGNYNSYIALRLLQAHDVLPDGRYRDSALRAISFLSSLERNGSVGTDATNSTAPFYYSAFLSAARSEGNLDFTANAGYILGLQNPDGSFDYSSYDNSTYPRQESYVLYSLALDARCFMVNCFGFGGA